MVATFAFLVFLFSLLWISNRAFKNRAKNKNTAPPPHAGSSWPLIGHLHLLGGPKPPHIVLGQMADKYGPIFTIKTGVHRALVVSDWETAKECLTTNDRAFATRPKTLATDLLSYNYAMVGFAPYGNYWRQMRKIVTLELLSNHRLDTLRHVRQSEVKMSLQELYKICDNNKAGLVDLKKWFRDVALNVILRMVVGKRIPSLGNYDDAESERWKEALTDLFKYTGKFVISNALPYLRWLDIGGNQRMMKKVMEKLDGVAEGWLQEHKVKRWGGLKRDQDSDFMDVMLSILTDAENHDADTINKATCLVMISAGSDTTMVTLTWALSLLLNNRSALQKAQEELDIHVGRHKQVIESDIKNLVYLQAIVKETLRLYPAGPLSVPHESMEDCTVSGYHIPAGTRLLINLHKLQRDPRVWSDPCEFRPERFLTSSYKHFDVKGQCFELIPFGSGRRMCPGVSFAIQVLELTLASLLHGFEFATPSDEIVDMSEAIGLTNVKATPLQVLITPRLPNSCY